MRFNWSLFLISTLNMIVQPMGLACLWHWFVVPITGFKDINFMTALGIIFLLDVIFNSGRIPPNAVEHQTESQLINARLFALGSTCISTLLGWLIWMCS